MAHTAGEWLVKQGIENGIMQAHFLIVSLNKRLYIARVQSDTMNLEEAEANARLIAAAPELLEACEAANKELGAIDSGTNVRVDLSVLEKLESAIAKAKGESDING